MAILKIKLKQHTPIIHFQHYQEGATLRASELKPKLDKFLIEKFKSQRIDYKKWLIGGGEHPALNYKIKIIPINNVIYYLPLPLNLDSKNHPKRNSNLKSFIQKKAGIVIEILAPSPFFANLDKIKFHQNDNVAPNKTNVDSLIFAVYSSEEIKLEFIAWDKYLLENIKDNISLFFLTNNFGARQDKGFGSYTVSSINNKTVNINENYQKINQKLFDYDFQITVNKNNYFKNLFYQLDLFYKALRAGINLKDSKGITKFYFKSLLFLYFKNLNIQWEKKTIKENFFNNYLKNQLKIYPYSDVLTYSSDNKKLVKDLLGLSKEEAWSYYKNHIFKTEAKIDKGGKWVKKNEKEDQIERFKSPIFFKIIGDTTTKKYNIYIKLYENIPIKGKWFIIEEKNGKSFPLQIPEEFNIKDFFEFIVNKSRFDIKNHVEKKYQSCDEYKILENIFNQLQK